MTVPKQYVTLSNGILKSSENLGENLRTDHWVMDNKHAPYLFFMGVGEYAVIKNYRDWETNKKKILFRLESRFV